VRLAFLFYGALLGASLLWAGLAQRSLIFASAEAAQRGLAPARDAALGALAAGVVVWLSRVFTQRTAWGEALARALAEVLGRLTLAECWLLAAVSGVAEEAFFRGAVQPHLGLVATSLLFALAHFAPRRDLLPWTGFSLIAGFLLGSLFEVTGNLVAPVVAHALVNGVNLRFLSERYAPED